jgi:hypothetical protein
MRAGPRPAKPFMRVVGKMLDLEEESARDEIIDADVAGANPTSPAKIEAAAPASGDTSPTTP